MSNDLHTILQTINIVNYEGLKNINIKVEDLLLLPATILDQQVALTRVSRELTNAQNRALARIVETHHFDTYV